MSNLGINNPLLDMDSYKASQAIQYPPGTTQVYSYIESRGGELDETVFFGLQMWLKQFLSNPVDKYQVDEAVEEWNTHGEPFDRAPWDYVINKFGGFAPLDIRAVPEGMVVQNKNVLSTITNTDYDRRGAVLVSPFETAMLRAIWYPTTVASNSYYIKKLIRQYFDLTSDDPSGISFKLHDFGARGVSSKESAGLGGAGHLVSFLGTDTMTANQYVRKYYGEKMAGFSIPAGEHSTVTTWGRTGEVAYLKNMIAKFGKPGSIFACPIDSYDTWDFIDRVIGECIDDIKNCGGTFVARPDSGDPLTVPVRVIERLAEKYGYTINSKGYKVLPPYLRVIQGDGITIKTIPIILANLVRAGFSVDNIAFGMGGGMLQHVNRDTFQFAMKCSAARINEKWVDVYKQPVDQPNKASKKGRFIVLRRADGTVVTSNAIEYDISQASDLLQPVWRDGKLLRDQTFAEIRKNAEV